MGSLTTWLTGPPFDKMDPSNFTDEEWIHTFWLRLSCDYIPVFFLRDGFSDRVLGQFEIQEHPSIFTGLTATTRGTRG